MGHATHSLLPAPVHSAHDESHALHVGVTVPGSSLCKTAYQPDEQIVPGPVFKWHLTGFTEFPEIVCGADTDTGTCVACTSKPAIWVRGASLLR